MKTTIKVFLNSMKGKALDEIEDLLTPEEEEVIRVKADENRGKLHNKGSENLRKKENLK